MRGPERSRQGGDGGRAAGVPAPRRPSESPVGVLYTWRDGEHTRSVWLQPGREDGTGDAVLSGPSSEGIAEHANQSAGPVFLSEGGILMTLPGGVVLVLEESWDSARVSRFLREQGIAAGRVAPRDYVPNAFLVATEPGFASLTLANSLAEVEGVVIASPNWRAEVALQ